ncbi:hypothetical protein GDO81_029178 [Engystomops pustulosus]|uniref:TIL domain-containing protein n=1 Tax=Engystomops pustulosus TaxID=76066 RepID=A0AAV6ZL95_ENGPU|nr:hypothetical protein GDO81_029178 [Engystomops pustulosus]
MGFFTLSTVFLLATPKCPENSTYAGYGICYLTCENMDTFSPTDPCREILKFTCKCDSGFLAQSGTHGLTVQCVRPEDCKAKTHV